MPSWGFRPIAVSIPNGDRLYFERFGGSVGSCGECPVSIPNGDRLYFEPRAALVDALLDVSFNPQWG